MKSCIFLFLIFFGTLSQAQISLNPAPISGEIQLNSSQMYIYLTNNGAASVTPVLSVDSNSAGISLSINRCPSIKPQATCYVVISFSNYGKLKTAVQVSFKNNGSSIALFKYNPVIPVVESSSFSVSSLSMNDFSNYTLSITNNTLSTKSYSPTFSGTDASKFSIALNRCVNIVAGGKCDILIKLAAQLAGSYSASFSEAQVSGSVAISSVITNSTVGVIAPPNPSISVSPSSLSFGTIIKLGQTTLQSITITNNGNISISPIVSIQGTGLHISLNRCLVLLGVGQSCSVSMYFDALSSMSNGVQSGLSISSQANSQTSLITIPISATLNIPPSLLTSQPASTSSIVNNYKISGGYESTMIISPAGDLYYAGPMLSSINPTNLSFTQIVFDSNFNSNYMFSSSPPSPSEKFSSVSIAASGSADTMCFISTLNNTYCMFPDFSAWEIDFSILAGKYFKQISVAAFKVCGIASDDNAYCWGDNSGGQLGDGTSSMDHYSTAVAVNRSGTLAGKTIKQIATTELSACAIASDNKVYCWGFNDTGSSAFAFENSSPVALDMSGALAGKTAKKIVAGGESSGGSYCIIASDDNVYCWGNNNNGQFATGDQSQANSPVAAILAGKTIKDLSLGANHMCVIASDDKIYCAGGSADGQLGRLNSVDWEIGDNSLTLEPVRSNFFLDPAGKIPKSIVSGAFHNCVQNTDDSVFCWGRASSRQLGVSTDTNIYNKFANRVNVPSPTNTGY